MIGIVMMSVLLAAAGSELPGTEDVRLFYPREIAAGAPGEMTAGDYTLWACATFNENTFVEAGGTRYDIKLERTAERKEEQIWRNLGQVRLAAGTPDIVCGPGVSMLALSRQSGFSPKNILAHLRALPLPEAVHDLRAERERDTNTVFIMPHYESPAQWEEKAAILRNRILLGSGLYPLPEKTPLNTTIFDEQEYEDYYVSKAHFEAWPGFLVTGNLYRPKGQGPYPAVVNPHGHWEHGRLEDSDKCSVAARCITLARMGAVAFTYDMIGYVDSRQTPHNWGNNQEKLWGIHTFGMQLWSGIRAVDFLLELPYVDPERIGCTGASGGGTQTFALTAVDERIHVAAPVNMISSTMQGGCLCENAPILRLDNSNMELGALAAPRPLLLISTSGDWTRETPRVEYPAIKSIYALYDAADKVENVHFDYGHNYNLSSREAMYRFFGRHLIGGDWDDFAEPAYEKAPDEQLRVFPGDEPPDGYLNGKALRDQLLKQARERRAKRIPTSPQDAAMWRKTHRGIFSALLGATTPHGNNLQSTRHGMDQIDAYILEKWVIGRAGAGDQIPALLYRGPHDGPPQDAVILAHGRGKAMFSHIEQGGPGNLVAGMLEKGKAVLIIDAFLTGEHHPPDAVTTRKNTGKFHDTFHPTDTAHRVQDVLTALAFLQSRRDMTGIVDLVGMEDAGMWCLLAGAIESAFRRVVVDMNQFDVNDDSAWEATYYIPGIRALGDVPAAVAAGGVERFVLFNALDNNELKMLGVYMNPTAQMPELP